MTVTPHVYSRAGRYKAVIRVCDNGGLCGTDTVDIVAGKGMPVRKIYLPFVAPGPRFLPSASTRINAPGTG